MKKRLVSLSLTFLLLFSLLPAFAPTAQAAGSLTSRNDGVWFYPVDPQYTVSDWAGCTGWGPCKFHNVNHYGDGAHDDSFNRSLGHQGIDIAAYNAPVYAARAGIVRSICYFSASGRGTTIALEHTIGNGYSYYSIYQHLSAVNVSEGQAVAVGDRIATSGNHMHFAILMASSGKDIYSSIDTIEGAGWITQSGNAQTGRILCNPSSADDPILDRAQTAVKPALLSHMGSVQYALNKNQVTTNGNSPSIVSDGTYILESKLAPQKAADVHFGAKDAEANIELWTKSGQDNQKFRVKKIGDSYQIVAVCSGMSMDVEGASAASGTNVQQYPLWGDNNLAQKWVFEDAGNGYVYIRSKLGTYLDVSYESTTDGTNLWTYRFNGSDAQKWRLIPCSDGSCTTIQDGVYILESKVDPTKAVGVRLESKAAGASIELWTKNGQDNQKFRVKNNGNSYQIIAVYSEMSMDVEGASAISGTNVQQYPLWGDNNLAQKWVFEDAGGGYVYIHSLLGNYLDVSYGDKKDGTNIWSYVFNGSDAQKWKLVPSSCAHTYGNWSIAKPASCTTPGEKIRMCSLCGVEEKQSISALGHSYYNGVCSKCGKQAPTAPEGSNVHFPRRAAYVQGQFSDVPANQWFTDNVANAFSLGLMKGNSAMTFGPYGDVTIAEAIAMAARIHSIYTTGTDNFTQDTPWYQCYLDYAYQNQIISYAYYNCDAKHKATRAQFAEIFAAALPDEALFAMNNIADNAIPDVKTKDSCSESIYKLYRAGILAGGDAKGTFSPGTFITRAECATIVARMADSDNRMSFSLS